MKKCLIILTALSIISCYFFSCDKKITGTSSPAFILDMSAHPDSIQPDEESQIYCVFMDSYGEQIGGETVWFEAFTLDGDSFGYISPDRTTSATDTTGLTLELYFLPQGNFGTALVTGKVEGNYGSIIASDSLYIEILPYIVELIMEPDTINFSDSSDVICWVSDPFDGGFPFNKHMKFIAPVFGAVINIYSDTNPDNPNGLSSYVRFKPLGISGEAMIIAQVIWGFNETVMGSDTAWVHVE